MLYKFFNGVWSAQLQMIEKYDSLLRLTAVRHILHYLQLVSQSINQDIHSVTCRERIKRRLAVVFHKVV